MDLFVSDAGRRTVARLQDYELDMAFGADENDFTLEARGAGRIEPGSLVFVPGTEYGGVVGVVCPARTEYGDEVSYRGRTWHGVLEDHVICPPAGETHYTASGDADAAIGGIIEALGLGELFSATSYAGIDVSRRLRYVGGYSGIHSALSAAGARLKASWDPSQARCVLSAVPTVDWGDVPGVSGKAVYSAVLDRRKYNHVIAIGKGEGTARAVAHAYADADGNVSATQTLTGADERAYVYDYSNAEADELWAKAREKLLKLRQTDEVDVDLDSGAGVAIGDTVTVWSPAAGISAKGTVTKLTVKVKDGYATVAPGFDAWADEEDYE